MLRALSVLILMLVVAPASARQSTPSGASAPLAGSIPAFPIEETDLTLTRLVQPDTYFDKTGRRFAVLGTESGSFEAWAYPIKLFRDFSLEFFIGASTEPIRARDIATRIAVSPHVTTITYVFQSFTVKAHFVVSQSLSGGLILLDVDSSEPLTIVAGFIPMLSPMWPGGLGGQYAYWDGNRKAYLISESSYKNHGWVGSPAAAGLSYTPAHMLSDQPNQFSIRIEDPSSVKDRFVPIVMAGGTGERGEVDRVYERIASDPGAVYRESRDHFEELRDETIRVTTPVRSLNLALEWAKVAYDNLLVEHPDHPGVGMVAGLDRSGRGGRPGFGWFFGGDTYINALSLDALGNYDASRNAIAFMTQFQRDDGKMAHEISQATGYVNWFEDYPYAYIHADTSPYYIVAVDDYYESTGDATFVRDQWEALKKAYAWSRATDGDGDGLMDNSLAGLGALEFGALTGIQSDIYLGAVWVKATEAMTRLARLMDDGALTESASEDFRRAGTSFEKYWSENASQYVYAFNEDGRLVEEITPWSAVGLMFSLGSDERARASLQRMAQADLTSDWGTRMLSTESAYFEPLNYNYGAVWPFLTSWVTTADFTRGLPLQGYSGLMSTVQHVFNRSLGQVTEVFSGIRHTWPQESVPHQGFCTAGTVLPFVRGLLGIRTDRGGTRLAVRPSLPADWDSVRVEHIRVGAGTVDIDMDRRGDRLTLRLTPTGLSIPVHLIVSPVFAPGTGISRVRINGSDTEFDRLETPFLTRPVVETSLGGDKEMEIEIDLQPTAEIVPPVWNTEIGEASHGLRVIDYRADGRTARVELQGVAGRMYRLSLRNAHRIQTVDGAELRGSQLEIRFPGNAGDGYVSGTIILTMQDS